MEPSFILTEGVHLSILCDTEDCSLELEVRGYLESVLFLMATNYLFSPFHEYCIKGFTKPRHVP